MSDTRNLKRHRGRWYLHLRLPVDLRHHYGSKTHLTRSLGTGDITEARRRRNEALGALETEWRHLRGRTEVPNWSDPRWLDPAGAARLMRAEVEAGRATEAEALEGIDAAAWDAAQSNDPAGLTLPADHPPIQRLRRIVTGAGGIALSDALTRHLDALSKTARASTVGQRRRRVGALANALHDPLLADVTRRQLAEHLQGLTGSLKTRRDTASDLSAFFGWCRDAGLIDASPADRLSRLVKESTRGVERDSRRPWSDAELARLMGFVDGLKATDYMRPLVMVAMYSGMRLNEICAITDKDIEDGCFVIREAKNKNSLRRVPIHSALLPLVEGLKGYLIPGLQPGGQDAKRGHEASKRFGRYKRKCGFDNALVFHGLRASFIAKLENAGVPVNITESIVGHRRQSMSYGVYSKGADMKVMREAVEKVSYEGLPEI